MKAIEFVAAYNEILDNIEKMSKEEYQAAIHEMRETDPHDLVTPETVFMGWNDAYGFVFRMVLKCHKA